VSLPGQPGLNISEVSLCQGVSQVRPGNTISGQGTAQGQSQWQVATFYGHLLSRNSCYLATCNTYQEIQIVADLIFISSKGVCGEDDFRDPSLEEVKLLVEKESICSGDGNSISSVISVGS
jgi:hypothetical protein